MPARTFVSVFLDRQSMPIPTILGVASDLGSALDAFDIGAMPPEMQRGFRSGVVLEVEGLWRGLLSLNATLGLDHNEIRHIRLDPATNEVEFLHTHSFPGRLPAPGR